MKQKLFSMLALLLMAATGAWAQTTYTVAGSNSDMFGSAWDASNTANDMTKNGDGTYSITYTNVNFTEAQEVQYKVVKDHSWDEAYPNDNRVINIAKAGTYTVTIHFNPTTHEVYETIPYTVTLADGTEDAENWTIEPKMGLSENDQVTITYTGTKRVKSVKAVEKEVGPEVTTFSELKTALSAGKDVILMNDIVCTEEIEITSGPLTIDGNGKKLSPNSAIRAFKVKSSATVAFKNLTLTGFVSGGSPAINNNGGTIVLDGCTISNCHVSGGQGGGAIENKGGGKLYAINTTFSGNYSGEIGGAINNYGGSLYMSDCTFTDNYTTSSNAFYGGAIGINGGSEIRLINCAFSGNKYGTNTGTNDIGVYSKPTNDNYTIAGCTGVTIASGDGDITTNASGTATLDYSDLSNISFTYTPVTVTWNPVNVNGSPYTKDGVTLTTTNNAAVGNIFYDRGDKTFTTTLGKFTKIEIVCNFSDDINGWTKGTVGQYEPDPVDMPGYVEYIYKLTWTGNAESVTIQQGKKVYTIQSITFTIQ